MANTTALFRGSVVDSYFRLTGTDISIQKPTRYVSTYNTWRGSVDLIGSIPESATIKSVRCDSGLDVHGATSGISSYTEGGYSNLLTPSGSVYGNFNNATLASYIEEYGISTIYYRVGVEARSNNWTGNASGWLVNERFSFYFRPWFEITYAFGGVEHKIKFATFSPTTGNGSWQRASTYAPVQTPDGVKWYESEVRYCIQPTAWVDVPNATAEEQPRTDRYEVVGADVPNKILNGYCGNTANTWNCVRGNDTRRVLTYHDAPPGTYKIRFSCAYNFRLYRANYDNTWHDLQISYQAGTYDYEITTTTTGFVGFMFIFNSTSEAQTFEMAKLTESGEPTWVLCGEEA